MENISIKFLYHKKYCPDSTKGGMIMVFYGRFELASGS